MLLAGLQAAITQPIRIKGGTIEEITLSYLVLKIWDLRMVILPVTCSLGKSFQSWTRGTSKLRGAVVPCGDYAAPVRDMRGRLLEVLQPSQIWGREVREKPAAFLKKSHPESLPSMQAGLLKEGTPGKR